MTDSPTLASALELARNGVQGRFESPATTEDWWTDNLSFGLGVATCHGLRVQGR